jgi:large subunit ribosomal protein L2
LPLKDIPIGFFVHNVELYPGQGGKFARSAGSSVQLVNREIIWLFENAIW